ncbi:MAG: type I DNA topoisomerase [Bacteroidales bacterium]
MAKNLVIVESPAKAKTIEGFLGKEFLVKSSFGHIRDLSKKELGVDIGKGFVPNYEISPDKIKLVKELRKLAEAAEMVWLASDEDREGEAISWHLSEALHLEKSKTKRIVFHEITKTAITEAIQNPRSIDLHLVDAQQARRVLDRLVGFELSPILWKKVKPSLSAGRVQSVAVRLIAEREDEIRQFQSTYAYRVTAEFTIVNEFGTATFDAELPKRFAKKEEAIEFLKGCIPALFSVADIDMKPAKKSPAPPFTTSTLQQEASRKLGFSVAKTMLVAQQLYESGKITYMRTDSVNLSNLALNMAKDVVTNQYGKEYVKTRQFATKSKGAQEAHEAIRPTYMENSSVSGDASQQRLYDLIWKRTLASQMADAELEKTNVTIAVSTSKENFIAKGEVIRFDGFLKVYMESTDDENVDGEKNMLPPMKKGEPLQLNEMLAIQKFSQQPFRYTEASLVKKLEELGIGRPSTYAPTISTIQKREYVVKEDREGIVRQFAQISLKNGKLKESAKTEKVGFEKGKLFPTDIGEVVNKFLMQYFGDILDYNFTANVEKEFDEIAQGLKAWNMMISEFYHPFHKKVLDTLETSDKMKGERLLGKDPASGKNIYVKIGRYGPLAQIGEGDDEEKPRFAGLKKGQSLDQITIDEALALFAYPRSIGEFEGDDVTVGIGRFGPYVKHKSAFFSLHKTDDPATIDIDRAIEIIVDKRKAESEKLIKQFDGPLPILVLRGRFGPYITMDKNNYKIPKGADPESLTLEDCTRIIKESDAAPKKKIPFGRKKR